MSKRKRYGKSLIEILNEAYAAVGAAAQPPSLSIYEQLQNPTSEQLAALKESNKDLMTAFGEFREAISAMLDKEAKPMTMTEAVIRMKDKDAKKKPESSDGN